MTRSAPAYLRNRWYMAGWSKEIGELLRRCSNGEPILPSRTANGSATALTDCCSHRCAMLNAGTREDDLVRCAYHGLVFNGAGQCVHSPSSAALPLGASVRRWPVHDRDGVAWLWMGDTEQADPVYLPDSSTLFRGGAGPVRGVTPIPAPSNDNLIDLNDIEFAHPCSLAGAGGIFAGQQEVRREGECLRFNWRMPTVPAPGPTYGSYERSLATDHWLEMRWDASTSMLLEIGAAPVGDPSEIGATIHQAHIFTPEATDTTHYFWASTRSTGVASEEGDAMLNAMMNHAFEHEHKQVFEGADANLDGRNIWDAKPASLGIDAGGTRARLVEELIDREAYAA